MIKKINVCGAIESDMGLPIENIHLYPPGIITSSFIKFETLCFYLEGVHYKNDTFYVAILVVFRTEFLLFYFPYMLSGQSCLLNISVTLCQYDSKQRI